MQVRFQAAVCPTPLNHSFFCGENSDQAKRPRAMQIQRLQRREDFVVIAEVNERGNHVTTAADLLTVRLWDVIPVQQCERDSMAIRGDPCPTRAIARINGGRFSKVYQSRRSGDATNQP